MFDSIFHNISKVAMFEEEKNLFTLENTLIQFQKQN